MSSKKSGYDHEETRTMAFSLVGAFTIGLQPEKNSVKVMKKIMITGKLGLIIDFNGMSCLALL